jgi:high affinity sulfate transporter 1
MAGHTPLKKLLGLFPGIFPITKGRFLPDIMAGITLAAMNIPQAMGYAKIAGTPVITGLYTLLLPVLAFALFGASRYLVVAADSATAVIFAVGVAPLAVAGSARYLALASIVALLAAGALLLARLLRLGFLADFLSRTVLIGFLTGVGFQVGIAVLGGMLGIPVHSNNTLVQLFTVFGKLPQLQGATLAVSAGVIAVIVGTRRWAPRVPGALIAVLGAIALSALLHLQNHGVEVIGPVMGGLPRLKIPDVSLADFNALLPIAGACFVMILAQSSATARAYATRHHQIIDENRDIVGLCAANTAAALSGTFVVNGSPTQTAMLETCGGRSQVANIATSATVGVVLLFLTGPLRFLPLCVLGAIVFIVAIRMIDLAGMRNLWRCSPREFVLALFTTAAVIFLGVEYGICLALVLSLLQHVQHSYRPHTAVIVRDPVDHWRMEPVTPGKMIEPGVVMYWFGADLYYANVTLFVEQVRELVRDSPSKVFWFVVDVSAITAMDFSAGKAVMELQQDLVIQGVVLAFSRVNTSLQHDMDRLGVTAAIGAERIFLSRKHCLAAYKEFRS